VEGLDAVACSFILIDAGQPIAQQGALDVMAGSGADAVQGNGRKCFIYLAVKAEGAARHRYSLCLVLGLVADGFVGGDGVEYAGLRAGKGEMGDGLVVEAQGVLWGTGAFNGEKGGQCGLVSGQAGANPGGERFGRGCPA
jgi:hypothetical protein